MTEQRPSKVFVVQVPARRDGPRGGWVEKYDLSSAGRFGALVRVLASVRQRPDRAGAYDT